MKRYSITKNYKKSLEQGTPSKKVNDLEDAEDKEEEEEADDETILPFHPIEANQRPDLSDDDISDEAVATLIRGLNSDQSRIFENIRTILTRSKSKVPDTPVLRKFISGVGGVGKSYLIHLLQLVMD